MRRLLSAGMAALLLLAVPLTAATPASAVTSPITVRYATVENFGWTSPIRVSVLSSSPVTAITVGLRLDGTATTSTPYATVSDFTLVDGTTTDGTWQSSTAPQIALNPATDLDVSVTDSAADQVTAATVGTIAAHIPTSFSEFTVTPGTVDLHRGPVSYAGRLVYLDAQGVAQPAVGVAVSVLTKDGYVGGSLTTDADGRFSGTAPAPKDSITYFARSSMLGGLIGTGSQGVPVVVQPVPTRITITGVNPAQPYLNDNATISGRLEQQAADGTWGPLASRDVSVTAVGGPYLTSASTSADGSFTASAQTTLSGQWTVAFDPGLTLFTPSSAVASVQDPAHLVAYSQFSMEGIGATQNRVNAGATVPFYGELLGPPNGAKIVIEFSTDGKKWNRTAFTGLSGAVSAPYENFSIPITVNSPGYWRAVYDGDAHSLPAVSTAYQIAVGSLVIVDQFYVSPTSPVTPGTNVLFESSLIDETPKGTFPVKNAKGVLQFSKDGSHWTTAGPLYSPTDGNYYTTSILTQTGSWRVDFPALRLSSQPIRIEVRGKSRITSFGITPNPVKHGSRLKLGGLLQGYGHTWYGLSGRTMQVFFRPTGAASGTKIGTTATSTSGRFTFTATATQSGTWWVSYNGGSYYFPVTSAVLSSRVA